MKKNRFDFRKELDKEVDNVCDIINYHPSLVHLFTSDDKGKIKINMRFSNWITAEIDENEILFFNREYTRENRILKPKYEDFRKKLVEACLYLQQVFFCKEEKI